MHGQLAGDAQSIGDAFPCLCLKTGRRTEGRRAATSVEDEGAYSSNRSTTHSLPLATEGNQNLSYRAAAVGQVGEADEPGWPTASSHPLEGVAETPLNMVSPLRWRKKRETTPEELPKTTTMADTTEELDDIRSENEPPSPPPPPPPPGWAELGRPSMHIMDTGRLGGVGTAQYPYYGYRGRTNHRCKYTCRK